MSTGDPVCDRCGTWAFAPHADGCALKSPRVAYCAPLSTSNDTAIDRAATRALVEALPKCIGTWTSGSGGHMRFSNDCGEPATTWDPESSIDNERQCDLHLARQPALLDENREPYSYTEQLRDMLERMEAWT